MYIARLDCRRLRDDGLIPFVSRRSSIPCRLVVKLKPRVHGCMKREALPPSIIGALLSHPGSRLENAGPPDLTPSRAAFPACRMYAVLGRTPSMVRTYTLEAPPSQPLCKVKIPPAPSIPSSRSTSRALLPCWKVRQPVAARRNRSLPGEYCKTSSTPRTAQHSRERSPAATQHGSGSGSSSRQQQAARARARQRGRGRGGCGERGEGVVVGGRRRQRRSRARRLKTGRARAREGGVGSAAGAAPRGRSCSRRRSVRGVPRLGCQSRARRVSAVARVSSPALASSRAVARVSSRSSRLAQAG